MEFTQQEIDQMLLELNTQPSTHNAREHDANWANMRREQATPAPKYDMSRTVRTQTPTVYDFGTHLSFSYRRYDGAHWHTELRNCSTDLSPALTAQQLKLKDTINTVLAVGDAQLKLTWITPTTKKGVYDPCYQLLRMRNEWLCLIDNQVYAQTSARNTNRGYTEIRFSTRNNPPIFTQSTVDKLLDKLLGENK